MGILDRLNRLVRSNISDVSGGRSIHDARRELESNFREAKQQLAELRRDEKKIVESIREARAEAEKWEDRAMLALEHDDEDLARDALKAKNAAVRRADARRQELEEHRDYAEDIEAALSALEQKMDAIRDRSSSTEADDEDRAARWDRRLKQRHSDTPDRSPSRSSPPERSSSDDFDTGETFSEFDRMAGKINEYEADVEAMRELNEDLGDGHSDLEDRFRDLESRGSRSSKTDSKRAGSRSRPEDGRSDESDSGNGESSDDDLADKKRRVDRLNELKDRFDD